MSNEWLLGAERIGKLADAVKDTAACEDLELRHNDKVVGQVASLLQWYQESQRLTDLAKKKRGSKKLRRQITATRNSVQDAAARVDAVFRDPVLRDQILGLYGQPDAEVFWLRGEKTTTYPDGRQITDPWYESFEIMHPDSPFIALLETARRLSHLASVLGKLESDESLLLTEQQNTEFGKAELVRALASVVAPYVSHKSTLADYIGDFLKLIDLNLKRKSILNLLSQNSGHDMPTVSG